MYEDRAYHGVQHAPDNTETVLEVTVPSEGWNDPHPRVLYQLDSPKTHSFTWGYDGAGTSATASAILADALDLDLADVHFQGDPQWTDLREAFCHDVLSQQFDEWRLRRRAVLRWARGWYAHAGIADIPQVLQTLAPPAY
jgi:hypothetical protein